METVAFRMRIFRTTALLGLTSALYAVSASLPDMARGADVGWLSQMESSQRTFQDSHGRSGDLLDILKESGINSLRLRVWVNPADHWCDSADVLKMALRAKAKGFRLMIDFHYSDSWADPGQQKKPAGWGSHGIDQLKADVSLHTTDVLKMLRDANIEPEWIQIGNETNDGMLWEEGRASKSMANFASLIQAGSKAAKAVFPGTKVVVHLSNGFDNALYRWIFDGLRKNAVEWDVIGMSLYPEVASWRATEGQCRANMQDMAARYGKPVVISEVGLDWDAADSCYALLKTLQADVKSLPNRSGIGVFYWEPASFAGWNGYQKGAFDNSGRPTRAMDAFKEAAGTTAIGSAGGAVPGARDLDLSLRGGMLEVRGGADLLNVTIHDMAGGLRVHSDRSLLRVEDLRPGTYLVKVRTAEGTSTRIFTKF